MEPGLTGNAILANTLARMRDAGIDGTVYTHPIGDHGHGAGPLIGRWDGQEGVPVRGAAVLLPSTWHSIELQTTVPIPEWDGKTGQLPPGRGDPPRLRGSAALGLPAPKPVSLRAVTASSSADALFLFRSEPDGVNELSDGITRCTHVERGDHGV